MTKTRMVSLGLVSMAIVLIAVQAGRADSVKKFMTGNQLNTFCHDVGLGTQRARLDLPDGRVLEGTVLCGTADLTKSGDTPTVPLPPPEDHSGPVGQNGSASEPSQEPSSEPPHDGDGSSSSSHQASSEPSHVSSSEPSHEPSSEPHHDSSSSSPESHDSSSQSHDSSSGPPRI